MTYEPMHSAQAQSVKVKEKYLLICWSPLPRLATLQEVRINVYFILISKSSTCVLSY